MTTAKVLGAYCKFEIVNDRTGKVMERVEGWAKDVADLVRAEYGRNYTARIVANLDAEAV
jgi:hypothetical protein